MAPKHSTNTFSFFAGSIQHHQFFRKFCSQRNPNSADNTRSTALHLHSTSPSGRMFDSLWASLYILIFILGLFNTLLLLMLSVGGKWALARSCSDGSCRQCLWSCYRVVWSPIEGLRRLQRFIYFSSQSQRKTHSQIYSWLAHKFFPSKCN